MNKDSIFKLLDIAKELPKEINEGIISLFDVESLSNLPLNKKKCVFHNINTFFNKNEIVNYSQVVNEYSLYYLPVNFYKVWLPLTDLLEKNQIKNKIDVLDLGSGPGTSSFGLIEFYKQLALDNSNIYFNLTISLVEREKMFFKVFDILMGKYIVSFPTNLKVIVKKYNMDVGKYFDNYIEKYDLIIESNLLNSNEKSIDLGIEYISNKLSQLLKKQSSIILIEPAREKEISFLKQGKLYFEKNGLSIYSPCDCGNSSCKQFSLAKVDYSNMFIIKEAIENGLIDSKKINKYHYFEYFVYRNDYLKKYKFVGGKVPLNAIKDFIGKKISVNATVISFYDKQDKKMYSLKICDGTLNSEEVWIDIPYNIFNCDQIISGRGDNIKIKDAIVVNKYRLYCDINTSIKIEG